MSFTFRPAIRENVGLILGVAGATGSGKTFSAMRLAKGMSGGKRFSVIDTENGRAKHYADRFEFDVGDLRAPFSPMAYEEAILAADAAGYSVVVVDSMSHEHAGDGGILDMQEKEFQRLGGRDSHKMVSWIKPKMAHKRMMSKLLQVRAHLVLCFRAEQKIEIVKEGGQLVVKPKASLVGLEGWIPVSEKTLPYELTASFLLIPDHPGVPHPIKLQEQHRALIDLSKPLDESVGEGLAEWARGGAPRDLESIFLREAESKALEGSVAIETWWKALTNAQRRALASHRARLKTIAEDADSAQKQHELIPPPAKPEERVEMTDDEAKDLWSKS